MANTSVEQTSYGLSGEIEPGEIVIAANGARVWTGETWLYLKNLKTITLIRKAPMSGDVISLTATYEIL
jgi:hypothetical protein